MTLIRSVSAPSDNESSISTIILSNPHHNPKACSGYVIETRSGDAYEYVGQFQTISLAITVVKTRLRLLGTAFGKCHLQHTQTGIRAVYANDAIIDIDIRPSECDGHVKTYRGTAFPHSGVDSLTDVKVELESVDTHAADGSHEETRWHVWFISKFEAGIRPEDLPRLIEMLREMHDVWLECAA